jgi:hypothetical protein
VFKVAALKISKAREWVAEATGNTVAELIKNTLRLREGTRDPSKNRVLIDNTLVEITEVKMELLAPFARPDENAQLRELDGLLGFAYQATEMRAAANFLVANYGRQKIITMPRSVPKIAIFEEAARTLEIPGGVRMIQEYYRQMRKFGCNILAVGSTVQQYDVLKTSEAG